MFWFKGQLVVIPPHIQGIEPLTLAVPRCVQVIRPTSLFSGGKSEPTVLECAGRVRRKWAKCILRPEESELDDRRALCPILFSKHRFGFIPFLLQVIRFLFFSHKIQVIRVCCTFRQSELFYQYRPG